VTKTVCGVFNVVWSETERLHAYSGEYMHIHTQIHANTYHCTYQAYVSVLKRAISAHTYKYIPTQKHNTYQYIPQYIPIRTVLELFYVERTELVLVCILVCIGMYGYVFGM